MDRPIRVVVIEDQTLVRNALAALLQLQAPLIEVAGEAANGRDGVALVGTTHPDVALLDIQMPDGDGISAAEQIRLQHPHTRTLLLTTFAKDAYLTRGLEAGAKGYVLKDTPIEQIEQLVEAIQAVAQNRLWISPAMEARWTPWMKGNALSDREQEILTMAATGMTNREIATELFMAEGSVKNLWTEILQKLEAKNRVEAIAVARSRGLID